MTDGYDYDFMYVDYDNDILIIVRGRKEHEYSYSIEKGLFEGGKANDVPYEEIGKKEDIEDIEDEKWGEKYGWQEGSDYYHRSYGGKSIRGSRW